MEQPRKEENGRWKIKKDMREKAEFGRIDVKKGREKERERDWEDE